MTWIDIKEEIAARENQKRKGDAQDEIRREKISAVERISGIPLVIYATAFTNEEKAAQYGAGTQIDRVLCPGNKCA